MTKEELKKLRENMGDFPVLREKSADLLTKIVETLKPNMVLELGSGKGFSGCSILSAYDKVNLLTIEKETENYRSAMENYVKGEFFERVLPVNADAVEVVERLANAKNKQLFDLIVLDCNKSSYVKMADNLIDLLSPEGVLFADDVLYFGKVMDETEELPEKKHRTIIVNLRKFMEKIESDTRLKNKVLYEVEDGVLVAVKKTEEELKSSSSQSAEAIQKITIDTVPARPAKEKKTQD